MQTRAVRRVTARAVVAALAQKKSMTHKIHHGTTLSATLLIAGTCIGAGMLALPLVTGLAGFWPAMAVNSLCWLFMLCTGLLFLETTLWMEDGANVLSMAERFFGVSGKVVAGVAFLFLYYCLMVAYLAGARPSSTASCSMPQVSRSTMVRAH